MGRYLVVRLSGGLVTIAILSLLVFGLLRVVGGDPALLLLAERMPEGDASQVDPVELLELQRMMGTDKPIVEQYAVWVGQLLTFDLGNSIITDQPIGDEIRLRFPYTFQLALVSVALGAMIGLTLGILAAVKQDTWIDYVARVFMIVGISMPSFWTGTLVIFSLLVVFHWFPPLGYALIWQDPAVALQQLLWPCLILGYALSAIISRLTRSQMLEVLRQDYIRTAWSKGLSSRAILVRHALRNAILPIMTILGIQFAFMLGGTVIIESIFVIPGMGSAFIAGLAGRDFPMVQNIVMLFSVIILVMNLMIDLMYSVVDPRIRFN